MPVKEETFSKVTSVITRLLGEPEEGDDASVIHKRESINDDGHKVMLLNVYITNPAQCRVHDFTHIHVRMSDENLGEFLNGVVQVCRNIENLWTDSARMSPGVYQISVGYN